MRKGKLSVPFGLSEADFAQWLGARIRKARERVGMSRAELGERIGYEAVSVKHIETGIRQPRLYKLALIIQHLGDL